MSVQFPRRLIVEFTREGVEVRTLYRSQASPGPGPSTKARAREAAKIARAGLSAALEVLDGEHAVELVGTAGFETREDTISADQGTPGGKM